MNKLKVSLFTKLTTSKLLIIREKLKESISDLIKIDNLSDYGKLEKMCNEINEELLQRKSKTIKYN